LLFLHALTPLSPGTGTAIDVIDQPIAREKATSLPFLPGATVKGVLRAGLQPPKSEAAAQERWQLAFGPEVKNAHEHAGALIFTDARLLLLPVRSERGVFAWATCPLVLRRFRRDLPPGHGCPPPPDALSDESVLVPATSVLLSGDRVTIEDLELKRESARTEVASTLGQWLSRRIFAHPQEQRDLHDRLAIVSDDAFTYLAQTATEVVARIRINSETRTVDQGGLWYEEALPAETILSALVVAHPGRREDKDEATAAWIIGVLDPVAASVWTMGGKETVGRGRVRIARLSTGGAQ
jgi:CRISPR-associated protein Cmr4